MKYYATSIDQRKEFEFNFNRKLHEFFVGGEISEGEFQSEKPLIMVFLWRKSNKFPNHRLECFLLTSHYNEFFLVSFKLITVAFQKGFKSILIHFSLVQWNSKYCMSALSFLKFRKDESSWLKAHNI